MEEEEEGEGSSRISKLRPSMSELSAAGGGGAAVTDLVKREPPSPEAGGGGPGEAGRRVGAGMGGRPGLLSSPPTQHHHQLSPMQNGLNGGSGSESDGGADAPLDFSMKSKKRSGGGSESEPESLVVGVRRALHPKHNQPHVIQPQPPNHDSNSSSPEGKFRLKSEDPAQQQSPPPLRSATPTPGQEGGHKNGHTTPVGEEARPGLGESLGALPPGAGALPGAVGAAMPGLLAQGLLPGAFANLPLYMDPRRLQQMQQQQQLQQQQQQQAQLTASNGSSTSGSKSTARPFKAYPKDPLALPLGYYGIPGMLPFPSIDTVTAQAMSMNSEDLFNQYRMYVMKCQQEQARASAKVGGGGAQPAQPPVQPPQPQQPSLAGGEPLPQGPPTASSQASPSAKSTTSETSSTTVRSTSSSPTLSTTCTTPTSPTGGADPTSTTNAAAAPAPAGSGDTSSTTPSRKRGRSLPDEQKDQAYWERRRKNNEAAKRSRDSRRAKEDEIAIRAAFLEQENLKLRVEVAALKNETAKLRCMLYNS